MLDKHHMVDTNNFGIESPQLGTVAYMVELHAEIKREHIPLGILLGPLIVLGPDHRFTKFLTRIALWLLKKARWELITSKKVVL